MATVVFAKGSVRYEGGQLSEGARTIMKRYESGEIDEGEMMDCLKQLHEGHDNISG